MTTPTTIYVTGSDGGVPVHEPERRWTQWDILELWAYVLGDGSAAVLPDIGEHRWIPNVRDVVVDNDLWKWYRVTAVDETTGVATLKSIVPPKDPGDLTDDDILTGPGPGTQADTYRVLLDQSTLPFTLSVDARLSVGGSMCSYAKIFKGANLGPNGKVISTFYDNQGNLLGDEVPLELKKISTATNYAEKTVMQCFTKEKLLDGELVTVVFYSDLDAVVSWRQCRIINTAFIRSTDSSTKYVTGISLKSPFLSAADPRLLQYPINVPLKSLVAKGVVHYSDGSSQEQNIDNNGRFNLLGFDNFVSTIIGQELPIVAAYTLSPGEVAYQTTLGENHAITESFRAVTTKAEGAYTLKLFCYPVWIDKVSGYRLEWFMYNLDRQAVFKVTPWVKIGASSRPFDPTAYGISQKLIVTLNLKTVNSLWADYNFTQTIELVLAQEGDEAGTPWTVAYDPAQNPPYGKNIFAETDFVNYNYWKLRLGFGAASKEDWLQQLYWNAKPLTDPAKEATAPVPNFFRIKFSNATGTQSIECQMSQWNQEMIVGNGLTNNGTLFIEFFKRTNDNDIQLAVAGMVIRQTNP
jgi:hypothetical protein